MGKFVFGTVDGVVLVNTTPHPITFGCGDEVVSVPQCGVLINATPTTETVRKEGGVEYIRTVFKPSEEGKELISQIREELPGAVIVGSMIAAQAYPGEVCAMVALPGYERVAPAEKRMDPHRFTIF